MLKSIPALAIAGVVLAVLSADAFAGTLQAAGPVRVNDKEVDAKQGVALKPGDRFEVLGSRATYTSEAKDKMTFEPSARGQFEKTQNGVEYVLLTRGEAVANLSDKTMAGTHVGWLQPEKGQKCQAFLRVPTNTTKEGDSFFRGLQGTTWIRTDGGETAYGLAEKQGIKIWSDSKGKPGNTCFQTSQENSGSVEVRKRVYNGQNTIYFSIPKASDGCVIDMAGDKTKIENGPQSPKDSGLRVETFYGQAPRDANVGPGASAVIDNVTGTIDLVLPFFGEQFSNEFPEDVIVSETNSTRR
jgi:hypothetical protein